MTWGFQVHRELLAAQGTSATRNDRAVGAEVLVFARHHTDIGVGSPHRSPGGAGLGTAACRNRLGCRPGCTKAHRDSGCGGVSSEWVGDVKRGDRATRKGRLDQRRRKS